MGKNTECWVCERSTHPSWRTAKWKRWYPRQDVQKSRSWRGGWSVGVCEVGVNAVGKDDILGSGNTICQDPEHSNLGIRLEFEALIPVVQWQDMLGKALWRQSRGNWRWARCRWDDPVAAKSTNTQIRWDGNHNQGLKEYPCPFCLEKSNKAS